MVYQYSKQNSSGLLLTKFLNNSYKYCNLSVYNKNNYKMYFIKDLKSGTYISNLELYQGCGIQLIRAAGTYGKLLAGRQNGYKLVRLPS